MGGAEIIFLRDGGSIPMSVTGTDSVVALSSDFNTAFRITGGSFFSFFFSRSKKVMVFISDETTDPISQINRLSFSFQAPVTDVAVRPVPPARESGPELGVGLTVGGGVGTGEAAVAVPPTETVGVGSTGLA